MSCQNYWANYGYWKVWEDADYFYAIDRPGGVTNKILKSAVCTGTQPPGTQPSSPQDNTWIKWVFVGIAFIAIMFISGGRR